LVKVLNWLGFLEAVIRPFLGASKRGRKAGAKDNVVQRNANDVSNPAQKPRTDDTIEDYEITSSGKRAGGERYRVYHDLVLRMRLDQIGRDQASLYKTPKIVGV
jgi:DNA transposition AAA+ family ATPase